MCAMDQGVSYVATCLREMRSARNELRLRGMVHASTWISESIISLGQGTKGAGLSSTSIPAPELENNCSSLLEDDVFHLARSLFESKEYRRCAHLLRGCAGVRSLFLRCYALFLAGEKRKEEEKAEAGFPSSGIHTGMIVQGSGSVSSEPREGAVNPDLIDIERELSRELRGDAHDGANEFKNSDPYLLWLLGVVLKSLDQRGRARAAFVASVNAMPYNWSAWTDLSTVCDDWDAVLALPLRRHWMADFFLAHVCLDMQRSAEALALYGRLKHAFPSSDYILAQTAIAYYNARDFDNAEGLFEKLLKGDPHRLDSIDVYSNILYVKECGAALSHLAHDAVLVDKYRPETCCVVGNYYSLKGQHEKAVAYFQRALQLNRNYLSAWTLMGHEYVELRNTAAAIEAYRVAVDISPRDYRAWYGLGQTYEILGMPHYALYYYSCATRLRPDDARMWCAMGQCYEHEHLGMSAEAIRCYRRAERSNDVDGLAFSRLAKLYTALGDTEEAARYSMATLSGGASRARTSLPGVDEHQESAITNDTPAYPAADDRTMPNTRDAASALLFLAGYHKGRGELNEAALTAGALLDFGGAEKELAKVAYLSPLS